MITVFEYETPISNAIKQMYIDCVDNYEVDGEYPYAGNSDRIKFVDYELAEEEITASITEDDTDSIDGIVMSYFSSSSYADGSNTDTANSQGNATLNVICFGIGDVSTEDIFNGASSTKTATIRSQQLATIAYKAIMQRERFYDCFDDFREENLITETKEVFADTDKSLQEKRIQSCTKDTVIGATTSNRSIVIYSYSYLFSVKDIAPTEILGTIVTDTETNLETENP